jgi:lipid II:glycine glycyltransferase (peptidoglycan interpeptide bridge formation enzyme)
MDANKICRDELLKLAKEKKIYLEGNILKVLKAESDDSEFSKYLQLCKDRDSASRRKRLDVTKRVQAQNKELEAADKENSRVNEQLTKALNEAEQAMIEANEAKAEAEKLRDAAMEDLDTIQKKAQFELIGTIVRVALWVIVGVGVLTTIMYGLALVSNTDTQIIGSTWSNMFGILLTNAFSIVGTIMGVKYATENKQ